MAKYLGFDIWLKNIEPSPRRRFRIRGDATFADLHAAIQTACGWSPGADKAR